VTAGKYEDRSLEFVAAFLEYENAAVRALARRTVVSPASDRKSV
jgi:hypothetical protein